MSSSPPVTRDLARRCAETTFADLDDVTVLAVEKALVDTLAACYAGIETETGAAMDRYVDARGERGDATVVGLDHQTSPSIAALANGTTAHALDVDDGHRAGSCHPGSPVIPAALAVAETTGATGRELVTAITVGYEAMLRVASAVQTSHRERGFHATATCGCFGAAVAVGSLYSFDAEEMAHALGLAGTQAGGLFEFLADGSMSKRVHPGRAAHAGILAGDLVRAGFDGPATIIEGTDGFARAFADSFDESVFETVGDPWEVTRTYIKPFPCCRHLHGPVEGAMTLRERVSLDAVESVRVETYATAARHDGTRIETLLDAQMSLPYAVAVAFVTGEAGLDRFDPPDDSPAVADLIERIVVVATDEMQSKYPATRPARVVVETTTGTESVDVDYPLGAAENPLSEAGVREKFRDLTDRVLDADRQTEILDAGFDVTGFDDVSAFARTL